MADVLDFLAPFLVPEGDNIEEDLELPSIQEMFVHYDRTYFGSTLGACTVEWSPRKMTTCAGICYPQPGGGCIMRLSEPLLKLVPSYEYKNTLIHEMIHAWNITHGVRNEGNGGHGPRFFAKAAEINASTVDDWLRPARGYNITQFHTMLREVDHYRVHHWECNRCGRLIKRAMNRRPQPADCRHFSRCRGADCGDGKCGYHGHIRACPQGEYVKVKEPEKQGGGRKAEGGKREGQAGSGASGGGGGGAKRPRSCPDGTRAITTFFKGPATTASAPVEGAGPSPKPAHAGDGREAMRARLAAAAAARAGQPPQPQPGAGLLSLGKRDKLEPPVAESSAAAAACASAEAAEADGSNAAAEALVSLAGRGRGAADAEGGASGSAASAGSRLRAVCCPVCGQRWASISNAELNAHIDVCLARGGDDVIVLD